MKNRVLKLLEQFHERIEQCEDCSGSGFEYDESACPRCGGQGIVLENCTSLISDLKEILK